MATKGSTKEGAAEGRAPCVEAARAAPLCGYEAMGLRGSVAMYLFSYVSYVAIWLCGQVAMWLCGNGINLLINSIHRFINCIDRSINGQLITNQN